jgi:acetyltransferase-like isoleucine patch superfamily enzyme
MINLLKLKLFVKARNTRLSRFLYKTYMTARFISLPSPKIIFFPLLILHLFLTKVVRRFLLFFYWQPLFEQYLTKKPKYMRLMNKLPYVIGAPLINIGEYCILNGEMVIAGRSNQIERPLLNIGSKVYMGFSIQIYIGSQISIGDNCYIADACILRGYTGHPIDPEARKKGLPEEENGYGDIILENNVWLGYGVKVNHNVRIGENSVIGTGSIVTHDIPPNVIAVGVPAKVVGSVFKDKLI